MAASLHRNRKLSLMGLMTKGMDSPLRRRAIFYHPQEPRARSKVGIKKKTLPKNRILLEKLLPNRAILVNPPQIGEQNFHRSLQCQQRFNTLKPAKKPLIAG